MKSAVLIALTVTGFPVAMPCRADSSVPTAPVAESIAQGVWLIRGGFPPAREPDGNTVVFEAPQGLVVVDTGRHSWHRQAILALADERQRKIVAVVNSHWHLDHVSGNPALRAAYPQLRVYASRAIDGALDGFLLSSAREYANYANDTSLPETLREDIRGDIEVIENGAALRPDQWIRTSTAMSLGGRSFKVNLVSNAVTSGDVWLEDEQSGVAVLGDLVTFPVPFLDTACPEGWREALAKVSASSFSIAVPGHGPPMTPSEVSAYRIAFESFVDCAGLQRPANECGSDWAEAVRPMLAADAESVELTNAMAVNYVAMLRANEGRSKYCEAPSTAKPAD